MARSYVFLGVVGLLGLAGCRSASSGGEVKPEASHTAAPIHVARSENGPQHRDVGTDPGGAGMGTPLAAKPGDQLAAFAGGCFWGVEDTFRQVPGVVATAVGYSGGHTVNPTYRDVCTHTTGHAETVLVEFDPKRVTFEQLLAVFFDNHDPTTMNRQGPDVGDQYRSAVFTFDAGQATAARTVIAAKTKELGKPVVTEVTSIGAFYKAEDYHQQYDEKTGTHSCPIGLPKGA